MTTSQTIPLQRGKLLAAALGLAVVTPLQAQNILTDLELSLVTDISGSVDSVEYGLQMQGYSAAFRDPRVHSALASGPNGSIAVNLIFYDGSASVGLPWTLLTNSTESNAFADSLDAVARPRSGSTNPASGIDLATSELLNNNYDGTRLVIDVSGDGTGSASTDAAARDAAIAAGIDGINGLPILTDVPTLDEYYEDNIQAGSRSFTLAADDFADFEAAVLAKIEAEILGRVPVQNSDYLLTATLRSASVGVARSATRDVGGRLARLRSGVRSTGTTVTQAAPPVSSKGGMAKGGMSKQPIVMTERCPWEVWGQVYYSSDDLDAQRSAIPGANALIRPDTEIDTLGGTVGVDYDINSNMTVGLALGVARSDVNMSLVGTTDIDALTVMPYFSYYRELSPAMALYFDVMYGYGMTEYSTFRLPGGALGTPDGNFHTVELNSGLNMRAGQLIHGPYVQLRWLDGTIDGYTEVGPGAAVFPESDYESLATQLGYQASYIIETGGGKLVPQARVAWEHEFEDDQGNILGVPTGSLDEDLAVFGLGLFYYVDCGWNVGIDYEARLGSETQSHYVGAKAGVEF